jgi:hypothetical protein
MQIRRDFFQGSTAQSWFLKTGQSSPEIICAQIIYRKNGAISPRHRAQLRKSGQNPSNYRAMHVRQTSLEA